MDTFLDFDSDGDADLLIGSLDDDMGYPDRLLTNDGTGKLKLVNRTQPRALRERSILPWPTSTAITSWM